VLGLAFADKGRTLWSCSLDGAIFEWDLGTDRRFGRSFGQQGDVSIPNDVPQTPPLAVSPDGAEFAVRSGTSGVLIRSTASAGVVKRFQVPGTGGDVTALAWGRSGLLAIAGQAGYVALWSISGTPHVVRVLKGLGAVNRLPEAVQAIAFSPDGSLLVAGDINHTPGATPPLGRVVAWQISSGKPVWKNTHRQGAVHVIAFSRDGMTVGAGYDDSHVVLFDARTGRTRRMLRENDGGPPGVYALAFSPDGEIAAGDWAGIVRVWNTATGAAVGQLTLVHPSPVASIHFSVTGDVFATTGGSDGFARLWSSQTRRQFGSTFPGDPGHWGNAVYTPDGSELVVAFDDGSGYVWPTSPRVWEEHACSVAGRNFTHEEWRRFVGGRSYTRVCPQFPAGS
jgi:WD40 repeat protein